VDCFDLRLDYIKSIPFFKSSKDDELVMAAKMSSAIFLAPTASINQLHGDYKSVYFLCKGKCTISKSLEFSRFISIEKSKIARIKFSNWEPVDPDFGLMSSNTQLCRQQVAYSYLNTGDVFPGLPMSPLLGSDDKDTYYYIPQNLHGLTLKEIQIQTGLNYFTSEMRLTSVDTSGCMLLKFPIAEFLTLMTQRGVNSLRPKLSKYQIETAKLQEAYLRSFDSTLDTLETPHAQFYVTNNLMQALEESADLNETADPFTSSRPEGVIKSRRSSVSFKKVEPSEIENIWDTDATYRPEFKADDVSCSRRSSISVRKPSNAAILARYAAHNPDEGLMVEKAAPWSTSTAPNAIRSRRSSFSASTTRP
jgi:hypothetical protein